MEIVKIKIGDLKPYENNPRINDKAVEQVKKSIEEFGFKVPIVVDKNNVIVTGHTRYEACKQLGINELPCIIADDLNDKQIKAFRLADNKVSDYSIWDNKKLLIELDELNFDIFTGFEKSEIFTDIKALDELFENDKDVIENNEEGVTYVVQFKTQDEKLIEKIKKIIEEGNNE